MAKIAADIEEKFTSSLKSKDTLAISVLRLAKSALVNERIAKGHELTESEEIQVLRREVKKREEAAEIYGRGGNAERQESELAEAEYLKTFLPAEMSDDDIRGKVREAIAEVGSDLPAQAGNFGKLMGVVMKKVGGQASGDRVSKILKKETNKN